MKRIPCLSAPFFTVVVCLLPSVLLAALVREMPTEIVQPDGTKIRAYVTGDEFYRSVRDKDGYTILLDPKTGFYTYAVRVADDISPSGYVVGKADPAKLKLEKGVAPSDKRLLEYRQQRLSVLGLPQRGIAAGTPTPTTLNNIVIFVRFSGESEFGDPITTYQNLFTAVGTGANSLRAYYREASYNLLDVSSTFYPAPSGGLVVSYVDSHPRAYYQPYSATNPSGYTSGNAAARHTALLKNAAQGVASQVPAGLNIDHDNDGNIDDVCYMFSGTSDAWADLLWPCCGTLNGDTAYINGKRVWTFNQQFRDWMFGTRAVGVLAHEMFHALGAPDLYHYIEAQRYLDPAGPWDVMEHDANPPQHMTAYMKWKYGGWISSIPTITTSGTYSLHPITSATNNCYKIASPYSTTEYFVVEYRRKAGTFESSIPGSGLIVYRINPAYTGNASGPPDELYVYRPGGTPTVNGVEESAHFSDVVGRTQINDYTNPKSFLTSGVNGGLDIANVGTPGDTITFQVGINQALTPSFSPEGGVYASGQTVTITCATPGAVIRYTTDGSEPTTGSPSIASGGAVPISVNRTLKAKAWGGANPSFTKTAKYAIQTRVYVDADSPGPGQDGTTWSTAFHSVQDAIDVANAGVDVWVAEGTYAENVTMRTTTPLYGGFKGWETALSQRNWVKNVTILDGGHHGTVVTIPDNATTAARVDGFTIQNGTGTVDYDGKSRGGGILTGYYARARIACNVIKSNSANEGGGVLLDDEADCEIYNNVIYSNTADDGAGIHCKNMARPWIVGNTIAYNTCTGSGGGVYCDDVFGDYKPKIRNNMIAWNSSGIYVRTGNLPLIENNCLWGNTAYAYGNVPDQTGLNGNISAYPAFRDSAAGDFHLIHGSGGIDAGSNMNLPSIYDRDGGSRAWDGNQDGTALSDCGAYEFRRIYVKNDSPGPQNGSTWAKAYHSVQAGLDTAVWPDEVWVARGTYFERITLKDGVALYGGFAGTESSNARQWWQNETIIDGSGTTGSVVTIPADSGPSTRLDGFTVRNGSGAAWGGGIWCGSGSAPKITNNKIGPNAAQYGGGIYCTGSSASITGNLFASNTASQNGGGVYLSASPAALLSYNTIIGNSSTGSGGGIAYNSSPTISSNVVAFNSQGIYATSGAASLLNNDVYGNTSGNYAGMTDPTGSSGNISADPRLAARDDGDYHLTDGSPCIDTARDSDRPTGDLEGRSRNIDGNTDGTLLADMGAYEFRRVYVKWNSSAGMYDGSTWTTAYHTIAQGLDSARPGDEIWVAAGMYSERITLKDGVALYGGFVGSETARSLRDWNANVTTLEAGNAGTAVTVPDESRASTRIDGFAIQHGFSYLPGGGIYVGQQSRVRIENNRILGNISSSTSGGSGGGIYSYIASPTIANNLFVGNSAAGGMAGPWKGGALCLLGGAPMVVNNTIAGNTSGILRIPGEGGGIYLESTAAVVRNNIIAFNSSGVCKNSAGAPSLDHNDVYGNTGYNYSNISAGAGDISLDPLFVNRSGGEYHVLGGSPCIDAGSGTGAPIQDIDAFPRPLDGDGNGVAVVDIGAYEAPSDLVGAKKNVPDNTTVLVTGLSVTACFPGSLNVIYVEKPDRSSGIRINAPSSSFQEGQIVTVCGKMSTSYSGERLIDTTYGGWVKPTGATLLLDPLGLPTASMGGGPLGLQVGMTGVSGLNNVGMLTKTWGRVTYTDSSIFCIDDGSHVANLPTAVGIRIERPAGFKVHPGQIVEVTGISACARISNGDQYGSYVRPRRVSDIVVLQTPVAYIRGSSTDTANSVKAVLDGEGFPTDIISNANAATADLSKYALIILGQDSGMWTDAAAVMNVNNTGKPIIGIETGGSNFFGKLGLSIATNSYYTGNLMFLKQPSSPIFHQPYEIETLMDGSMTVSTNSGGWYGYKPMGTIPGSVEALGSRPSDVSHIMLAREGSRYLFWPFRDRPDLLTTDGKHLFINACWYALR